MAAKRIFCAAVVALALGSAPAQAADVLVLGPGGKTARRADPGVAARDRTPAAMTHPAVRRHARPLASASARRTVASELKRLYHAGRIDHATYAGYRAEYRRDRRLARKLSGRRRLDMAGVLGTVDRMAARGSLTTSRLVPLWLQLRRNREWWSTGPLLASGQRVSFKHSELVFQYVPGEGLQIHPLANFGKLNALWRSKVGTDRMERLMNELLAIAAGRARGIAWEYYFDFDGGAPPWVSSLSQGTGLQSLARAAVKSGRGVEILPRLRKGLTVFETAPPSGVRTKADGGLHYVQYSFAPKLHILNGFIQSLVGLYDFATIAADADAQKLFVEGDVAAKREVPRFDTGSWSLYSRGGPSHDESNLNYHQALTDFLTSLCDRTDEAVYCDTVQHFDRYEKENPEVALVTQRLRGGRTGFLRFRLSKISRVNVQMRRSGKLVLSYGATLGYGTRAITVKPPRRAGSYDVRISATDLAGNSASLADTVRILKYKR